MVKLNRIYTRTGDDGSTGLATGDRVLKSSLRVEAYGEVDEANATIGLAIVEIRRAAWEGGRGETREALLGVLGRIQHDLFDLGADLATPAGEKAPEEALRIVAPQTAWVERQIDRFNERLGALTSFVLPGGSAASAALHLARTVTRRAERAAVELHAAEPDATPAEALRYLNRLSDLLFVLARIANDDGKTDELWVPGAGRVD